MVSTNGLFKHQEERKCYSCGDQILVGKSYMRCDESEEFCDSYYCKRCVGCPKGHMVALCRLKEAMEPTPCVWKKCGVLISDE